MKILGGFTVRGRIRDRLYEIGRRLPFVVLSQSAYRQLCETNQTLAHRVGELKYENDRLGNRLEYRIRPDAEIARELAPELANGGEVTCPYDVDWCRRDRPCRGCSADNPDPAPVAEVLPEGWKFIDVTSPLVVFALMSPDACWAAWVTADGHVVTTRPLPVAVLRALLARAGEAGR